MAEIQNGKKSALNRQYRIKKKPLLKKQLLQKRLLLEIISKKKQVPYRNPYIFEHHRLRAKDEQLNRHL